MLVKVLQEADNKKGLRVQEVLFGEKSVRQNGEEAERQCWTSPGPHALGKKVMVKNLSPYFVFHEIAYCKEPPLT